MPPGQTLATYTKRGPADRLAGEAALLRRARHPGVVDLVELRGEPDAMLVTRLIDGPSLAEGPALPVDDVAGLVSALATTVADLHRLGVAHNSILPEHILVASGGRPVLCGLADGVHPGDSLDFARDVAALGELLRWLLARAPQPQGSRHRSAGAVPALLTLALRATSPDPRARPTADALATGVRAVAPHATLPGRAASSEAEPRRWPRVAARAVVAAAIVSVTLVAVMRLDGTTAPDRRSRPPAPPKARTSTSIPSVCAAVGDALRADVDGDGCEEPLRFAGGVLEAGPARWAIGGPADDVVTGDWNCDGRATIAFLDRGTGGVYRFDRWPDDRVVAVPLIAQVENATDLRVTHRAEPACDLLTVARATGPPAVVE